MDIQDKNYKYLAGFNNYHQTEAEHGALPKNQNSPQKASLGLYAEQLSGSAFTTPRVDTKLSWCYRITPSVRHQPFIKLDHQTWQSPPFPIELQTPNQLRWLPDSDHKNTDFISSIKTICGFGNPHHLTGAAASVFYANQDMSNNHEQTYISNHDADMLIVMQNGSALFTTEFGLLEASCDNQNSDIVVIPRGARFKVDVLSDTIAGYICENFGSPFALPELGPIGANGLAHPRHFLYPVAHYEPSESSKSNNTYKWICKYHGKLWQTELNSSPCNIVAWHGNYAPYKYNLNLFNTINTVSFDHPDPSIFTVLTSPSSPGTHNGVANLDFAIFPPRWMVAENTFRPPYFHRNIMSEFMGLIKGEYDAKKSDNNNGFIPGGYSIHNRMMPHGPDCDSVLEAEKVELHPNKYENTLAFMFESNMAWDVSEYAINSKQLQKDYYKCWQDIPVRFKQE